MKRSWAGSSIRTVDDAREFGYPTHVYPYTAGIAGGIAGGIAMIIPALAYGLLSGRGIWYPINLVAATILRGMQAMSPTELTRFYPSALVAGLVIHLVVSAALGLIFAILLPTLPGRPVYWALVLGPLLWFGATLIFLPQVNPVMSQLLDWPSFMIANIVYGLVMGGWVMQTPMVEAHRAHHLHLHRPVFLER